MITPYCYRLGTTYRKVEGEELSNLSQVEVAYHINKHPESIYYIDKYVQPEHLRERSHPMSLYTEECPTKPEVIIGNFQTIKVMYGDYPFDNFDISVIKMLNKEEFSTLKQIVNSDKKCIIVQSDNQTRLDNLKKEFMEKLKFQTSIDSGLLFFSNNIGNWVDRYEYLHNLSKTKKYLFFEEGNDFNISNIASRSFLRDILGNDEIHYRQLFKEGQSFNTRHMKVILFCKEVPLELSMLTHHNTEVIKI